MFKRGIYTVDALRREVTRGSGWSVKQVAITLLPQLATEPDGDRLRERVLLELADDRGAYKRTYKARFVDFDVTVCQTAARVFPPGTALKVMDCGVSDGRTSVDLFTRLQGPFPDLEFVGTDYDPYVRTLTRDGVTVVFSSGGEPIQLIDAPFVLNLRVKDRWTSYPINRLLLLLRNRTHIRPMLDEIASPEAGTKLGLYCVAATSLAANDPRFSLDQHDVLDPFRSRYHLVRMMNVLNPTYFSPAELHTIVRNARDALLPGGLFVVGSNQDAGTPVAGGIYRLEGGRFVELAETGIAAALRSILLGT